jgi:hypothetical protein
MNSAPDEFEFVPVFLAKVIFATLIPLLDTSRRVWTLILILWWFGSVIGRF